VIEVVGRQPRFDWHQPMRNAELPHPAGYGGSMSFTKLIVPAVAASFFAFAPAPASAVTPAPTAAALGQTSGSMLLDVQYWDRRDPRYRRGPPPRAHRGPPPRYRSYDRPPRGWRRYQTRPRDWDRRGCAMVGPVWFCP